MVRDADLPRKDDRAPFPYVWLGITVGILVEVNVGQEGWNLSESTCQKIES